MSLPSIPTLNLLDFFVLALSAISVVTAFRHGLVKVVFSLSGLIVGVLVAGWVHSRVYDWLQPYVVIQASGQILSFLAVVFLVYASFVIGGEFASRSASGAGMGMMDRLLGAGIGLLRGGLVAALLLVTISVVTPRSSLITESVCGPYLLAGNHAVSFVVPEAFREQIGTSPTQLIPVEQGALEARTTDNQ